MSETDPMTIDERRKYIHKMWGRYRAAGKSEKTKLLNEIIAVTGMHRKAVIRILNGRLSRKKRSRERGREYRVAVDDAIKEIAKSLDYPCAERLHPRLVWQAEHLHNHGELLVQSETLDSLGRISVSTVKRILKRVVDKKEKIAFHAPKKLQTRSIRKNYPMTRIAWDTQEAGHLEADLVHHCGETSHGEYIHGLQLLDVASGWCEIVPIFGRSFRAMADGLDFLLARIPFPVIEIHPDNGSEFFNHFLIKYLTTKLPDLLLSRSRPYQKNDNRFVEENNHSLLRAYIGHGRFDTLDHLRVLRRLYDRLWLYHNLFLPAMHLIAKEPVTPQKFRRTFDPAKPPLERLIQLNGLDDATRSRLQTLQSATNSMALKRDIERSIVQMLSLPVLSQSMTVNVFETLIRKEADVSLR